MAEQVIHQLQITGPSGTWTVELSLGITIVGRLDPGYLLLAHPLVSRQHAKFICILSTCKIYDLNSSNGTTVNGAKLSPGEPHTLQVGDVIEIGPFQLTYSNFQVASSETELSSPVVPSLAEEVNPTSPSEASRSIFEFVHLRLHTAVPESVTISQPFELAVSIRLPMSKIKVDPDLSRVKQGDIQINWPLDQEAISLKIVVQAPSCEIHDWHEKLFKLRYGQNSPLFYFVLTPQIVGKIAIIVSVYHNIDSLGSARIWTNAATQIVGEITNIVMSHELPIKGPLTHLLEKLTNNFDLEELRTLCFDLDIKYEEFSWRLTPFARDLITYCHRHKRINDLMQACARARPGIYW